MAVGQQRIEYLQSGIESADCCYVIAGLEPHYRQHLVDVLAVERLERKMNDVLALLDRSYGDWSQTLYAMLFVVMGGPANKKPFGRLADKVRVNICNRERGSLATVEALLLGASGLLTVEGGCQDQYLCDLQREYLHLSQKYVIDQPMARGAWNLNGYPAGYPVMRIAQTAALLCGSRFDIGAVLSCRTRDDLKTLFDGEVSDYWTSHYLPSGSRTSLPKRIGLAKIDLLGINLVAPMLCAYGHTQHKFEMKEQAIDLLNRLPAEHNSVLNRWSGAGVTIENAFHSQALLQLEIEYCRKRRCGECPYALMTNR